MFDDELDPGDYDNGKRTQRKILKELIAIRIISTNKAEQSLQKSSAVYYELAHDAILSSWKQLSDLLQFEKNNLAIYHQLSDDTRIWKENRKALNLWSSGHFLDVVSMKTQFSDTGNPQRIALQHLLSTLTFGYLPNFKETRNQFNKYEILFIKESIVRSRRSQSVKSFALGSAIILTLFFLTAIIYAFVQNDRLIREKKVNAAISLANDSQSEESFPAFSSLQTAYNLDPDNSIMLQRAFELFSASRSEPLFFPTSIIPLKHEIEEMTFANNDQSLILKDSTGIYEVNLQTGKRNNYRKDLQNQTDENGFINSIEYNPTSTLFEFRKSDPYVNRAIVSPNYLRVGEKFLMISDHYIKLGKYNGLFFANKDTCLSEALYFEKPISSASFLKDSTRAILASGGGFYLADFKKRTILLLVKKNRKKINYQRLFTLSVSHNCFAAVSSNHKLLYVWDFDLSHKKIEKSPSNDELFHEDYRFMSSGNLDSKDSVHYLIIQKGNRYNISFYSDPNDYTLLVARNPDNDEFVLYRKVPDREYLINQDKKV